MKLAHIWLAGICLIATTTMADMVIKRIAPGQADPWSGLSAAAYQQQMAINNTVYMDDWRIINGVTNRVTDKWIQFSGQVIEVHEGGVRIQGSFFCAVDYSGKQNFTGEFFVSGFPYAVAQGDTIGGLQVFRALPDGVYKYNTVAGGSRTLHQLLYGVPCSAPPKSAAEIEAERQLAAKKKIEGAIATLKSHQQLCEQGDAYGQLRMAEHYRDGDGVETNLLKAKYLFMQSSDQGNATAAKELAELTNSMATGK